MARYAVIVGGIVENVIEAPAGFTLSGKTLVQSNTAGPGDTYSGGVFIPYVDPVPSDTTPTTTVIKSPDGTVWHLTVDNDGKITTKEAP